MYQIGSVSSAIKQKIIDKINLQYINSDKKRYKFQGILDKIIGNMKLSNFDLLGFSLVSGLQFRPSLVLAKSIKEKYNIPIVLGGPFVKLFHNLIDLKKYKFIDYLIISEGELPLLRLVEYLEGKLNIDKVPSLKYINNNRIITNEIRSINFNDVPVPYFPDIIMKPIISGDEGEFPDNFGIPYELIRGCKNNCMFCTWPRLNKCEFKNIEIAIKQLKTLKKMSNFDRFRFIASSANMSPNYLERFCDALIKEKVNIRWICHATPNINLSLLIKMKKAGCFQVLYGIESGSQKISKAMNKLPSVVAAERCIKDAYSVGIKVVALTIIGYPHETVGDFNQTLKFIIKNKKYFKNTFGFMFCLRENSPIFENPENNGVIIKQDVPTFSPEVYAFDEIRGLRWNKKVRQTEKRIKLFKRAMKKHEIRYSVSYDG